MMINDMLLEEMIREVRKELQGRRPADGGIWRGHLSSSAISTSVAVFALIMADREKYAAYISKGTEWLLGSMKEDGSWGDSIESPSNMTATLLSYASLRMVGEQAMETRQYLDTKFGGSTDKHIIDGVKNYYGRDLTFSAPILMMCALAGIISSWDRIPQLPFELSVLPQKVFRFLQLPVVSYAIPALIAVGILRFKKGRKTILSPFRQVFIGKSLEVLEKLQPEHGGFLEAAPLTAFVSMCMCGSGYTDHICTQRGIAFLIDTVREDGSWPIDTDLASWVTALSVRALGEDIQDREALADAIRKNAFTETHAFTGARPGGWGWTDLQGSVPDADDTSGALVALHLLRDGNYCEEVGKGIEWLLALQNRDGGMPTFCKGWGKLPFDRSSPDISAHSLLAFNLWMEVLPENLQKRCNKSMKRMLRWMNKVQADNGSWSPLWFGDQDAEDKDSPVYATAMTVEYLAGIADPLATEMAMKGKSFLLETQNPDGGWGGARNVSSKVTLTARSLSALASFANADVNAIGKGFDFLHEKYRGGTLYQPEPIGLYFSKLWYSEELYNLTFVLSALKKLRNLNGEEN